MNVLQNLTVRASVLCFVAVAMACALVLAGLAYVQGRSSEALADRLLLGVQMARAAGTVDMMHDGLRAVGLAARLAGPGASDKDKEALRAERAEMQKSFDEALATLNKTAQGDIKRALADAEPTAVRYLATAKALVDAALTDTARAEPLIASFDADFASLEDSLAKVSATIEAAAHADVQARDDLFRQSRLALGAGLLVTVAVLLGLGLPFARSLVRRLGAEPQRLNNFARCIAAGELHTRFDRSQMAAGSVADAMLMMRDRLRDTVMAIREGAEQVASGSAEIAGGSQAMAARTETQASQVQQAASAMEEMTRSVEQTAEHARAASQLAASATAVAVQGGHAVKRVVDTMGEIQGSSRRIAEIISVIDGIAFQTNILALNAAVEAARAGDQGRGFAVVASEVRSLAGRSAGAAREIKALIDASVQRVNDGHRLVNEAGSTMEAIVSQVRRVNDLIGEISTATNEQTCGITAVGKSMTTLDQGTQQSAAMVEESAASANQLKTQAARLQDTVSVFALHAT
jgi:methyl-accepting chemotaxis protein